MTDFGERPYIVIWEATQACDLACVHCRACAQPLRHPRELSTVEAQQLIDQVAALEVPVFVISGDDPLKRPDLYDLVGRATSQGLRTSLTPSATPLLTQEAIARLQWRGLARLAISLDGSNARIHDAFRRVPGSYDWTLQAVRWARELGVPVQINTTITRRNLTDVEAIIELLKTLDIVLWSVFFLVPTGRGQMTDLPSDEQFEDVFQKLYAASQRVSFDIKTTEAQHYRRYLLQQQAQARRESGVREPAGRRLDPAALPGDGIARAPRGLNDGKGFLFVSHTAEVYPSGFLPLAAGNIREEPLAQIYRCSPLFVALRDSDQLGGKCGACEFRQICGGSRARAFAVTGDPFAEDPCCVYRPGPPAKGANAAALHAH